MTIADLDNLPFHDGQESPATRNGATGKPRCRRHDWNATVVEVDGRLANGGWVCLRCGTDRDPIASRRSRNNGKRGRRAELDVARSIPGGRKMGPLGLPWDVEVGTYARLQVKKLIRPPSLAEIARLIRAIPDTGDRLRGFVWVEAAGQGKRGQRLVWFLVADFMWWHGPGWATDAAARGLVTMPLDEWAAEFVR